MITAHQIREATQKLKAAGYRGPFVVRVPVSDIEHLSREFGVHYLAKPGAPTAELTIVADQESTMACKVTGGKRGKGKGKKGR